MTRDVEAEVRHRLRRAELPSAPHALRERVATVAATKPGGERAAELGRSGRLLVPLAAVLLIGAIAILGGGSRRGPETSEWGPLAVSSEETGAEARNEGFLVLTETCAFLERGGDRETLVWPAARTSWDSATATVTFRARDGSAVSVRNGDYIELGGGGSSMGEDGLSADAWADRIPWVARPSPDCVGDDRFVLNHVAIIEPPRGSSLAPHTRFDIHSTVFEWCSPFGCEFHLELRGPGGPWRGRLDLAELGLPSSITPRLPASLATGTYSMRSEIHVFGDAIYPGETGPRDLGTTATCSSDFVVEPTTTVVAVTLGFWLDRCAAGTVVTADARALATISMIPRIDGDCGGDVGGCDYRLALTGPGGSWGAIVQTVKPSSQVVVSELVSMLPPGSYRLEASAHRMSEEPFPGVGHQRELDVAGTCFADFVIAPESGHVDATVSYLGESCSVEADVKVVGTQSPGLVAPVPTS